MNSNSRVVITGSSGFIGSSLRKYFKEHKVPCLGISRKTSEATDIVVKNYHEVVNYNDGNTLFSISDSLYGNLPIKLTVFRTDYYLRDYDPNSEFEDQQYYYSNAN